jgi:hypothetical protein
MRPPVGRTLALVLAAGMHSWWNPVSWFNSLVSFGGSTLSDLENWVKDAINKALSIYDDVASLTIAALEATATWASDGVTDLIDWSNEAVGWINNITGNLIPAIGNWAIGIASGWVNDLRSWTEGAFTDVYNWATTAISGIVDAYNWTVANIIDPVSHWVDNAETWLQSRLASWWDTIWANTIGPIWSALQWLVDNVPGWVEWLAQTAYGWVLAVIKAGGWILWMGEHDFDDLVNLIESTPGQIDHAWLNSVVAQTPGTATEVEDWFARLLG